MLAAGVKVTFIFTFIPANIIDGKQKFTHKFAFASGVFMGVYDCLWVSWMSMGFYEFLGVCECIWVSMGADGCLWVSMGIYEWLWVYMGVYGYL